MTTVITTNVNIENEIKAIMEQAGLETMDIAGYVIRYTKFCV